MLHRNPVGVSGLKNARAWRVRDEAYLSSWTPRYESSRPAANAQSGTAEELGRALGSSHARRCVQLSGMYQIGDVYARSCSVGITSPRGGRPAAAVS